MWWPRLGGVRPSPEGEPGTFHDAALDVTFLNSVCLGHEELGLRVTNQVNQRFRTLAGSRQQHCRNRRLQHTLPVAAFLDEDCR